MQREPLVAGYPEQVERTMKRFFDTLREKDKRRYAAVEAAKFGPGGLAYVSRVLGIDPSTIRQGEADLARLPPDEDKARVRRPGGGRKKKSTRTPRSSRTSRRSSTNTPPAVPSSPASSGPT
jgi:hypothetical protein